MHQVNISLYDQVKIIRKLTFFKCHQKNKWEKIMDWIVPIIDTVFSTNFEFPPDPLKIIADQNTKIVKLDIRWFLESDIQNFQI